jgi:Domain of unknown function (DUF4188)
VAAVANIVPARMTAELDGEFVVFLIGMRVNKLWKLHRWIPVATAMGPMLAALAKHPELGLLGYRMTIGWRGPTLIQYWRSSEHLLRFARDKDNPHLEPWRKFNRTIGTSGDVGIWHETYVVPRGSFENIYVNMPAFGLGKVGKLESARGERARAAKRLAVKESGALDVAEVRS